MCLCEGFGAPESATECCARDSVTVRRSLCDIVMLSSCALSPGGPFLYCARMVRRFELVEQRVGRDAR